MPNTTATDIAVTPPSSLRRMWKGASGGRRLLAAAAVMHIVLAFGLHWAGRAQVAPGLIDRDGIMDTFAHDSYEYQRGAVRLAEVMKNEGGRAWAGEVQPLHVRLISILFMLLGPLSGYGILSAEPLNLLCYLAVVGLTLLLGREVGGERAGLLAAGAVALWPTFLLHTLQLLKDSLFIAAALALVLCVTTWLTRTYSRASAAGALALLGITTLLLLVIRLNFVVVILVLALAGLLLLVVRQFVEGRLLYWNMVPPVVFLASGALLFLLFLSLRPPPAQRFKHYPSDGGGKPKPEGVRGGEQLPSIVEYHPSPGHARRLVAVAEKAARKVGGLRHTFSTFYPEAGSGIDRGVKFDSLKSLILYLPRAMEIGLWAPFPNTWVGAGRRVGSAGKLLSGAEMIVMYLVQLLALAAVLLPPRRLAAWLLLGVTTFGVTALALVFPNVGAIYRFRYTFWVLLIVLGAKGLESLLSWRGRGPGAWGVGRASACVALACTLAAVSACSSDANPAGGGPPPNYSVTTAAAAANRACPLGFELANTTGATLRAVYISRSDSGGWEENLLSGAPLADGQSVVIGFSPEERAREWDIRIVDVDARFADWKGLLLVGASNITLRLDVAGRLAMVADVEYLRQCGRD